MPRRIVAILVSAFFIVLVASLAAYRAWRHSDFGGALVGRDAAIKKARAEGLPLSTGELVTDIPPEEENAASAYASAARECKDIHLWDRDAENIDALARLVYGEGRPGDAKAIRTVLDREPKAVLDFERGTRLKTCVVNPDWITEGALRMGPLQVPDGPYDQIYHLIDVECARAVLAAKEGDLTDAWSKLSGVARCCRQLNGTPLPSTLFIDRADFEHLAMAAFLGIADVKPEFWKKAGALEDLLGPVPELVQQIRFDIASGHDFIMNLDGTKAALLPAGPAGNRIHLDGSWKQAYESRYLQFWNYALDHMKGEGPLEQALLLDQYCEAARSRQTASYRLNAILFESLPKRIDEYKYAIIQRRLFKLAQRIYALDRSTGHIPTKTPDWGEISEDPYGGRLAVQQDGDRVFVLSSSQVVGYQMISYTPEPEPHYVTAPELYFMRARRKGAPPAIDPLEQFLRY